MVMTCLRFTSRADSLSVTGSIFSFDDVTAPVFSEPRLDLTDAETQESAIQLVAR